MPLYFFQWDDQTLEHLAEHDVTQEEFEQVVQDPERTDTSRSSGRPVAYGYTAEGRYLLCVYEFLDPVTILPVTAYELD